MSESPIICIIGMHRSGTSMIAHLLNICGLDLGPPERLLAPQGDNPLGFFENAEFLRINDALLAHFGGSWRNPPAFADGWEQDTSLAPLYQEARNLVDSFSQSPRWGWKDPRTTILIPFWKSLMPELRFVICVRNPLEVAQSLGNRDGFSIEEGSNLWDYYMHSAIKDTGSASRVLTFYEDYFIDSLDEIDRVVSFCSLQRPDDSSRLRDTVSRELRHHNAQILGLLRDKAIPVRQKMFYTGLRSLSLQITSPTMPESARIQLTSDALDRYADLFTELPDQEALRRLELALGEREGQLATLTDAIEQNTLEQAERISVQTRLEAELADLTRRDQEQHRIIADRGEANARLEAELADLAQRSREQDRLLADREDLRTRLEGELANLARRSREQDRLLADREEARTRLEAQLADFNQRSQERDRLLADRIEVQARLEAELADANQRNQDKDQLLAEINFHFLRMQQTVGWKALETLRGLIPSGSKRRALYLTLRRSTQVVTEEGPSSFFTKAHRKIRLARKGEGVLIKLPPSQDSQHLSNDLNAQYRIWLQQHLLTREDFANKQAELQTFSYAPCVSIATPVYNTDEVWLRKAIDSVRAQIYPNWELCLVNDASTAPQVRSVLDGYAAADSRIKVKHLKLNEGIAGASNHALGLATGEFVGLLDHDDELPPDALFEAVKRLNGDPQLDLMYSDEDKLEPDGHRVEPFFKPDWSPDLLLSMNYITHFSIFRRRLLEEIGGFRTGFDGSQDHDLLLRFTERTNRIAHIPRILYHWRKTPNSAAASTTAKPEAYQAGMRAIREALGRSQREATVEEGIMPGMYKVRYEIQGSPLVSIIIPTRDKWQLLQQCINSIEEKTSYPRYEVIVIDNNSVEPETRQYLDTIAGRWRVFSYPERFNFAAINNFGVTKARGEHLLFLNNDTQVIRSDWLTGMLEHSQRPEVGAVGARLLYPDGRIQHAGVVLGLGGVAGHAFKFLPGNVRSYFDLGELVRNCSAVTAACMMVPRRVFEEVNGFDERFRVAFNDVDLCLRIRQRGYLEVYTPIALLYHHESASRGALHPPEDEALMRAQWDELIRQGDPYYNPNLTLAREDWSLRI